MSARRNGDDSTYVRSVTVIDPDTGLEVSLEIRKLDSGAMVGLDCSFLEQLDDDDEVWSPYDKHTQINIPSDELSL